ncbi:hypothetical protein YC2023_061463 [Brassica napus]
MNGKVWDKLVILGVIYIQFCFTENRKVYRDIVGSAYYVAPEVLRRRYEIEVDIWSAGIILNMAATVFRKKGIFDAILEGQPWPSISYSAKDWLPRMLTADLKRRISAAVLPLSLNSGGSRQRARYQIKALDETKPTPLTPHQSEFGRVLTLSYNKGGKFDPETKISLNHIPVSYSNKQQQKQ